MNIRSVYKSVPVFLLAVIISFSVVPVIIHFPAAVVDDDAFFYTQIAYNMGTFYKSTFDSITITNGYHILWQLFLGFVSFAAGIFTQNKTVHLFIFVFVDILIFLIIANVFFKKIYEKIACFFIFIVDKMLMETLPLTMFFLIIIDKILKSEDIKPSKKNALYFLAVIAVPLTRIDATIILFILFLYFLYRKKLKIYCFSNIFLAAGVLLHFIFLKCLFGEFFTVSSILKYEHSFFSIFDALLNNILLFNSVLSRGTVFRNYLMIVLMCGAGSLLLTNHTSIKNQKLLFVLWGTCAFFAVYLFFEHARPWYFFPGHIILFYIILNAELREKALSLQFRKYALYAIILIIFILFIMKTAVYALKNEESQSAKYAFVQSIKEYTPPDARIYMIDGCGYVAFFSQRNIVNGDGLVNNYAYAERLMHKKLWGYLDEMQICYLIENRCTENGYIIMHDDKTNATYPVKAYGNKVLANYVLYFKGLKITKSEVTEILKSNNYGKDVWASYKLYKLNRPDCPSM